MYFVEPIARLFAVRYLNMYVYWLSPNITLIIDTIYSLKFLRLKLFLQHNLYPDSNFKFQKVSSASSYMQLAVLKSIFYPNFQRFFSSLVLEFT